jgi:hypothetical protein
MAAPACSRPWSRGSNLLEQTWRRMGRSAIAALAAGVFALTFSSRGAEEPAGGGEEDGWAAFRMIAQRNIFDPNRSGPSVPARPREVAPPARVETFALVGTMVYEKGRFAFFDGSSSEYRRAAHKGETIAGFTVEEITPQGVKLVNGDKVLNLALREEVRREDEGEWKKGGTSSLRWETRSGSGSGSGGSRRFGFRETSSSSSSSFRRERESESKSSGSGGSDADASEVLKRLMEQREKELK